MIYFLIAALVITMLFFLFSVLLHREDMLWSRITIERLEKLLSARGEASELAGLLRRETNRADRYARAIERMRASDNGSKDQ